MAIPPGFGTGRVRGSLGPDRPLMPCPASGRQTGQAVLLEQGVDDGHDFACLAASGPRRPGLDVRADPGDHDDGVGRRRSARVGRTLEGPIGPCRSIGRSGPECPRTRPGGTAAARLGGRGRSGLRGEKRNNDTDLPPEARRRVPEGPRVRSSTGPAPPRHGHRLVVPSWRAAEFVDCRGICPSTPGSADREDRHDAVTLPGYESLSRAGCVLAGFPSEVPAGDLRADWSPRCGRSTS